MPRKYQDDPGEFDDIDELLGIESVELLEPANPFAGLTPCGVCEGSGDTDKTKNRKWCDACHGIGYLDMPTGPTQAKPGSDFKIAVLAARYEEGLSLYDPDDWKGRP